MSLLPTDKQARKAVPLYRGLLKYFPDALCEVARLSMVANEQHSPGEPLHWAKEKSTDEPDALLRHLIDAGTIDDDGMRHSAKVAWRALAMLQRELEAEALDKLGAITTAARVEAARSTCGQECMIACPHPTPPRPSAADQLNIDVHIQHYDESTRKLYERCSTCGALAEVLTGGGLAIHPCQPVTSPGPGIFHPVLRAPEGR